MRIRALNSATLVFVLSASVALRGNAQVVYSASGTAAGIQSTVDSYRAALGTLNPNNAGSLGSGRREINWDGVPNTAASPNDLPANFFNATSARGVVMSTPGSAFRVSANAASGPILFGDIDPTYTATFSAFSSQRVFASIGSNVTDVRFFVPGGAGAAFSRGFGAVFSDIDLANTTSLEFFDGSNSSLGTFFAPTGGLFSFLGIDFGSNVVRRVRITAGNTALGPGASDQNGNSRDVVVMDDFIFGEPGDAAVSSVVPEPSTYLTLGFGLLSIGAFRRRRHVHAK